MPLIVRTGFPAENKIFKLPHYNEKRIRICPYCTHIILYHDIAITTQRTSETIELPTYPINARARFTSQVFEKHLFSNKPLLLIASTIPIQCKQRNHHPAVNTHLHLPQTPIPSVNNHSSESFNQPNSEQILPLRTKITRKLRGRRRRKISSNSPTRSAIPYEISQIARDSATGGWLALRFRRPSLGLAGVCLSASVAPGVCIASASTRK